MRAKTTRAFRTISEAGDELGLQPHVLRFWESKFSDITPIKRGGGRRFYRPEDIEFLRGIKTLLYEEKHPIKDVQKLIAKSGAARIVELGRSVEQASRDRDLQDTTLVPERIDTPKPKAVAKPVAAPTPAPVPEPAPVPVPVAPVVLAAPVIAAPAKPAVPKRDTAALEDALSRLQDLRKRWDDFDAA